FIVKRLFYSSHDTHYSRAAMRKFSKNLRRTSWHSASKTPARTSGTNRAPGARKTSTSEPHAPVFGSHAPKTTEETRAAWAAPAHMAHGSKVTTNSQPSKRQESPYSRTAARIASTSACAVGSAKASRRLTPAANSTPSGPYITAPTGTPPAR